MASRKEIIRHRAQRVRRRVKSVADGRLRLSVHRSSQNIYAQLIDDSCGRTVASASTLDRALKGKIKTTSNCAAAEEVGKLLAERAKASGHSQVVFDRGAYIYHGRIKALAEAARAGGLVF